MTSNIYAWVSETHSFCLMNTRQRSILCIPTDVLTVRAAAASFSPAPVAASVCGLIWRVGGSDKAAERFLMGPFLIGRRGKTAQDD